MCIGANSQMKHNFTLREGLSNKTVKEFNIIIT